MTRSTPGLPVHHQLLEFTQTHVHRVGDAIQPSHPLLSPFPLYLPKKYKMAIVYTRKAYKNNDYKLIILFKVKKW